MSFPESGYDSFQVFRPLLPTPEIEKVLRDIVAYAVDTLPGDVVMHVREQSSSQTDYRSNTVEGLAVPSVSVYGTSEMRLPLFERQSPRSANMAPTFSKAMQRISAPTRDLKPVKRRAIDEEGVPVPPYLNENPVRAAFRHAALQHDIPNPGSLRVNFGGIQEVIGAMNADGREYAFIPRVPSPELDLLNDESRVVGSALDQIYVGPDVLWPASRTVVHLPFVRIPLTVPDERRHAFLDRIGHHSARFTAFLGEISYSTEQR